MQNLFPAPPKKICILRLSALGDVCHVLPMLHTIQAAWPDTEITWIVGKIEYQLLSDIPNIKFVIFDKSLGFKAFTDLGKALKNDKFDLLMHMQTSLRSNIASLFIKAKIKLGYDKARAKELHSLVTNQHISGNVRQHQVDSFLDFTTYLGLETHIKWDLPINTAAKNTVLEKLDLRTPILAINPCSSPSKRVYRNWYAEGYAKVAEFAIEKLGYQVVLCGGKSEEEQQAGKIIESSTSHPMTNLIGDTSIKELVALLHVTTILITSDSGPAHIATAVNTPVIAIHGATNPFQTGPYDWQEWTINHYPESIKNEYKKPVDHLPWGIRAHGEEVMKQIKPEEVMIQLEKLHHHLLKNVNLVKH